MSQNIAQSPAVMQTQSAPVDTGSYAEPSMEEQLAAFSGADISAEVDRPPPKKQPKKEAVEAKESKPVAEPPPEPEAEDEESDGGDDFEEVLSKSQMERLLDKQAAKLETYTEQLAAIKEENELLKKRAAFSIESIFDDEVIASLSVKERKELASYLFYSGEENVDHETKSFLDEKRRTVATRKEQERIAQQEAKLREEVKGQQYEVSRQLYRVEAMEALVDMIDDVPTLYTLYGNDRKRIVARVFDEARRIAEADADASYEDVDPKNILQQLESLAVKHTKGKQAGAKKKPTSGTSKGKTVAGEVASTEDEDNESIAAKWSSGKW